MSLMEPENNYGPLNIDSIFTAKTPKLKIVENDPDDDKFFECAVALKAKYIISGDKEVLEVEEYMGIKILSPKQFIDEIENHENLSN